MTGTCGVVSVPLAWCREKNRWEIAKRKLDDPLQYLSEKLIKGYKRWTKGYGAMTKHDKPLYTWQWRMAIDPFNTVVYLKKGMNFGHGTPMGNL